MLVFCYCQKWKEVARSKFANGDLKLKNVALVKFLMVYEEKMFGKFAYGDIY